MKRVLTLTILWMICSLACDAYAQLKYSYYYRPEKAELETDFSYWFGDALAIGARHDEEKDFCRPVADDDCITYLYFNFPVWNGLRLQIAYGDGFERDMELLLFFERGWLYFEVGGSETDPFFFEVQINF